MHPILWVFRASVYQLATPVLAASAQAAVVYKEQRFSDHAPLMIDYEGVPAGHAD